MRWLAGVVTVVVVVVVMVSGNSVATSVNLSDTMPTFVVRQEAALRKLDQLIAQFGKVDALEAKIDRLTSLLISQGERHTLLEARMEDIEARQESLLVELKDNTGSKLQEVEKQVARVSDRMTKMQNSTEEQFHSLLERLDSRLQEVENTLVNVSMNVKEMNVSVSVIGASVCQVEERLEEAVNEKWMGSEGASRSLLGNDTLDVTQTVQQFVLNTSQTVQQQVVLDVMQMVHQVTLNATQILEKQLVLNVSLATDAAVEHLKTQIETAADQLTNSTTGRPQCDSRMEVECEKCASRLERLFLSVVNTTKALTSAATTGSDATRHLVATLINRLRVSNLAMDKRLAALLHTSALRQSLLQDNILAALTALDTHVSTQANNVSRHVETRLGVMEESLAKLDTLVRTQNTTLAGLEDYMASSTHLEAEEVVRLLLEATTNITLNLLASTNSSSSSSSSQQCDLRSQQNTSAQLDLALLQLEELHNLTMTQLEVGRLCGLESEETWHNGTVTYTDPPLTLLDQAVSTVQERLAGQLTIISEQLSGLRIYFSTSLHMHTQQLSSEVGVVVGAVRRVVQDTLAKSTRSLEKLRRASLGHLDAAVTSVSSAAVASAQSTSDHITQALSDLSQHLSERLTKLEEVLSTCVAAGAAVCPPGYTWVGGACLLPLHHPHQSWQSARRRCREMGGDLATTALHHTHFPRFHAMLHTPTSSPELWVGGRKVEHQWQWVTGGSVLLEVGLGTPPVMEQEEQEMEEEEEGRGGSEEEEEEEDGECLVWLENENQLVPGDCQASRAALCQYQQPHATPATLQHHSYTTNNDNQDNNGQDNNVLDIKSHALRLQDFLYLPIEH